MEPRRPPPKTTSLWNRIENTGFLTKPFFLLIIPFFFIAGLCIYNQLDHTAGHCPTLPAGWRVSPDPWEGHSQTRRGVIFSGHSSASHLPGRLHHRQPPDPDQPSTPLTATASRSSSSLSPPASTPNSPPTHPGRRSPHRSLRAHQRMVRHGQDRQDQDVRSVSDQTDSSSMRFRISSTANKYSSASSCESSQLRERLEESTEFESHRRMTFSAASNRSVGGCGGAAWWWPVVVGVGGGRGIWERGGRSMRERGENKENRVFSFHMNFMVLADVSSFDLLL